MCWGWRFKASAGYCEGEDWGAGGVGTQGLVYLFENFKYAAQKSVENYGFSD
jgi:hypothetical protein